jgi:hypothetical protein
MNKFWDTGTEQKKTDTFDFERNKRELLENLDYLMGMSVQEQTLYKKWVEWNQDLHGSMKLLPALHQQYDKIWEPADILDYDKTVKEIQDLEPFVELVEDGEATRWTHVRKLISSMEFSANPGRNVKAFVKDRKTNKILGVISLGSDITSLGVRDNFIGWKKEDKFVNGKLNNTTIGTSIIATQPLGYNFLGGKLLAALTTSPVFRKQWKDKYNNTLIAVGTTALYGASSQYNAIPHFKTLGESKGLINIKPDDKYYDIWHQYVKNLDPEWYDKAINATGPKQNVLMRVFKEIGVKASLYNHGFKRGVYFAQMYENGNDFLCSKIEEDKLIMKPKFEQGDEYTIKWWKDKAIKRYTTLHSEGRLKDETLYFIDVIGMTWEQCKEKYLKEVGR